MVRHLASDARCSELALLCRKKLPEWDSMEAESATFKDKVRYLEFENFDDLATKVSGHETSLDGYDAFFCTLGTRTKVGEELFKKVDYQYPLDFARIGLAKSVKYYGLLSSTGASASSMFLYMRTKGEVERDVKALDLLHLSIFQPGLLTNRDNDHRIGEAILSWFPITKIEAKDCGKGMIENAIRKLSGAEDTAKVVTLSNGDLRNLSSGKM
uniref:Uncharacterized protein n=1 Tax=Strombidium inclinatum TaxID=197538 RepID=A0A7S3IM98_9SPIT